MKIVFEHAGVLPVVKYGGTERIIFWLMKELVKLGHDVHCIGHPDSNLSTIGAKLIPHPAGGDWRHLVPKDADVVHTFYTYPGLEVPHLVTIEGNGQPGEKFAVNTVFVSKKHAEIHSSDQYVYNGIDLEEYPFVRQARSSFHHFLFLAKARWKVKNVNDCVRATKATKKELSIAGGRVWSFSPRIHNLGMVAQQDKLALFQKVDALLWPVRWHEPFGIAVIEAFSQGLPVIASGYGSLRELVTPECGVIAQNYDEFVEALSEPVQRFDAKLIRDRLEKEFSTIVMAKRYVEIYERLCAGESLHTAQPQTLSPDHPETLLPF
jgi:glycosyltransferase involved in cell wall biosynthesis